MKNTNIKTTVEELQKLLNINNFIGEPIETEDKLLIPVMKMGFGFGSGENILGSEGTDITGAGAGAEPTSMVVIPKNDSEEGIRILDLTGGDEINKTLNDVGILVTDLINEFIIKPKKEEEDYDEAEFIEPAIKETDEE